MKHVNISASSDRGEKYILEWPFDFKIESQSLGHYLFDSEVDNLFPRAFHPDFLSRFYLEYISASAVCEKHIRPLTLKPSEYNHSHFTSKMSCQ